MSLFYVFLLSYFEILSLFAIYKAEILVGTAAGNLKLDQNPCAMALSKKAGQCLQGECDKKKAVPEGNIAVLQQTGGLKCQAVIFAICADWGNGKGRQVSPC